MTISHYGSPTGIGNGRRLVLNDVDKEKLVEMFNLVPYQPSPASPALDNTNQISNDKPSLPVNGLVQQSPGKPTIPASSSAKPPSFSSYIPVIKSSSISSSSSHSSPSFTNLSPSPSPSSFPSRRPLFQLSSSRSLPPLPPSSSSSATSPVTTPKHSPSPVNNFDYHSVNEVPNQSPFNTRNETSKEPEEQRPKGFFTADEIALTRQFLIDKPNFCDTDNGASLDLLILVNSAVGNFEARQAIRQTWGKFAVERGSLLLFLIGNSRDANINSKVKKENEQYSDLLQGAYIDSYYNLTLKTMSMMKWVSDNCDKVKFVLKVDDDMFINMQLLVDFCETRTFTNSIIGHIAKKWKPHRDAKSKWFVSQSVFNGTVFPNFATGPCYMFSGDVSKPLSEQSYKMKPLHLEDVFMTGIVAEAAKVRRLNYALMKNVRVKVNHCNFKRLMTSHKHTPKEIITLWNQVYDEMDKPCEKPVSKPTTSAKVTKNTGAKKT